MPITQKGETARHSQAPASCCPLKPSPCPPRPLTCPLRPSQCPRPTMRPPRMRGRTTPFGHGAKEHHAPGHQLQEDKEPPDKLSIALAPHLHDALTAPQARVRPCRSPTSSKRNCKEGDATSYEKLQEGSRGSATRSPRRTLEPGLGSTSYCRRLRRSLSRYRIWATC